MALGNCLLMSFVASTYDTKNYAKVYTISAYKNIFNYFYCTLDNVITWVAKVCKILISATPCIDHSLYIRRNKQSCDIPDFSLKKNCRLIAPMYICMVVSMHVHMYEILLSQNFQCICGAILIALWLTLLNCLLNAINTRPPTSIIDASTDVTFYIIKIIFRYNQQ